MTGALVTGSWGIHAVLIDRWATRSLVGRDPAHPAEQAST